MSEPMQWKIVIHYNESRPAVPWQLNVYYQREAGSTMFFPDPLITGRFSDPDKAQAWLEKWAAEFKEWCIAVVKFRQEVRKREVIIIETLEPLVVP
jgi:hypothetical protein